MKILGKNSIMMRTCDTDQLVLDIAALAFLQFDEFWLSFGVGRSHKYIPIHDLVHQLGHSVAKVLSGFHAFISCDTMSSFHGKGKKTCWDIFQLYPEFFPAFRVLSEMIPTKEDTDAIFPLLRGQSNENMVFKFFADSGSLWCLLSYEP